ncbi:hypothetical protein SeLEV6574_g03072 [Synchytrium endobioticum]|nr:hypothetical protein SeLEV6574_g03072 [Synchytrium endobioticum]
MTCADGQMVHCSRLMIQSQWPRASMRAIAVVVVVISPDKGPCRTLPHWSQVPHVHPGLHDPLIDLIDTANALLASVKVPVTLASVQDFVPSLWVALYEGITRSRLSDVVRDPASATQPQTRASNIAAVIAALEGLLKTPLDHIKPADILACNVLDIANLLEILEGVASVVSTVNTTTTSATGATSSGDTSNQLEIATAEYCTAELTSVAAPTTGASGDETADVANTVISTGAPGDTQAQLSSILADQPSMASSSQQPHTIQPSSNGDIAMAPQPPTVARPGVLRPQPIRHRKRRRADGSMLQEVRDDVEEFARVRAGALPLQPTRSDEGPQASIQREKATPSPSKKRLRFNLEHHQRQFLSAQQPAPRPSRSKVSSLLRPAPTDTPYTKALKAQRAELLREQKVYKSTHAASSSMPQRAANQTLTMASSSITASIGTSSIDEPIHTTSKSASVVSAAESRIHDDDRDPKSMPEKALAEFERVISQALPGIDISPAIRNLAWNKQLNTWEKALNARNWNRRVDMHKATAAAGSQIPVEVMRRDIERTIAQQQRQQQEMAARVARHELLERVRRVTRMEARHGQIEKEVEAFKMKKKLREEQIVRTLYEDYLRAQRAAIIEIRAAERERTRNLEGEARKRQQAREQYFRDEVAMLQESIKAAQKDEAIAIKAKIEGLRRLARDEKEAAKEKVRQVREKLAVDADDVELRNFDASIAKRAVRFG